MPSEIQFAENEPYRIEILDSGEAIVHFAPICDHDRTPDRLEALQRLVSERVLIICNLTSTQQIVSAWIRKIERMTSDAENMGKSVVVVGMSKQLQETADVQGIGGRLKQVSTIEEAMKK
ncbi:MAG: hypothetical protein K8T91_11090 [Planctomycetes bacterium]|nr:hypothetical protein [Planctomycetota bacterium]